MKPVACLLLLLAATSAQAVPRDMSARQAFRVTHPCPATGKTYGRCPGWEIDHIQALVNGGPDTPANMQWLTHADHMAKTREDLALCKTQASCTTRRAGVKGRGVALRMEIPSGY